MKRAPTGARPAIVAAMLAVFLTGFGQADDGPPDCTGCALQSPDQSKTGHCFGPILADCAVTAWTVTDEFTETCSTATSAHCSSARCSYSRAFRYKHELKGTCLTNNPWRVQWSTGPSIPLPLAFTPVTLSTRHWNDVCGQWEAYDLRFSAAGCIDPAGSPYTAHNDLTGRHGCTACTGNN